MRTLAVVRALEEHRYLTSKEVAGLIGWTIESATAALSLAYSRGLVERRRLVDGIGYLYRVPVCGPLRLWERRL